VRRSTRQNPSLLTDELDARHCLIRPHGAMLLLMFPSLAELILLFSFHFPFPSLYPVFLVAGPGCPCSVPTTSDLTGVKPLTRLCYNSYALLDVCCGGWLTLSRLLQVDTPCCRRSNDCRTKQPQKPMFNACCRLVCACHCLTARWRYLDSSCLGCRLDCFPYLHIAICHD
jgi:hypothetical protein